MNKKSFSLVFALGLTSLGLCGSGIGLLCAIVSVWCAFLILPVWFATYLWGAYLVDGKKGIWEALRRCKMEKNGYFWGVNLFKERLIIMGPFKTKPEAKKRMLERIGKGIVFKSNSREPSNPDVRKKAKRYAKRLAEKE